MDWEEISETVKLVAHQYIEYFNQKVGSNEGKVKH